MAPFVTEDDYPPLQKSGGCVLVQNSK